MSNKVFLGYSWVLLASIWSTIVNIVVDSEFFFGYSLMGILGYSWVFLGILGFSFGFLEVSWVILVIWSTLVNIVVVGTCE